jgi:hypothetical protein
MVSAIFGTADRNATTTWGQPSPADIPSSASKLCAKFITTNKNGEKEGAWRNDASRFEHRLTEYPYSSPSDTR